MKPEEISKDIFDVASAIGPALISTALRHHGRYL